MYETYDVIIIGAGSGGITAARFAAELGVKAALVEKNKIGGDCTWTGCVPSKALLKVAKMAHAARVAQKYGINTGHGDPTVDMARVRSYVQRVIAEIHQHETPEHFRRDGIDIISGAATFVDARTIQVGSQQFAAKKFIIATGAHPFVPPIPGLQEVPYLTYLQLFENEHLPEHLAIIGAGPIGAEMAQAYRRLGAQVTLIDVGLLPREEPEASVVMERVFAGEGIRFIKGLVSAVRRENAGIVLTVEGQEVQPDMLLVAVGRVPHVNSLKLEEAGVKFSARGIPVNSCLQTNIKHIYAVGDCVAGNYQFTHFAGWQGYKAIRNALLPGSEKGTTEVMPWTTFTDPEVAHVGLTEAEAREQFGDSVQVVFQPLEMVDRAVTEDNRDGFFKVVFKKNGKLLGATVVAERAGEMITEYALALQRGLKMIDLANVIRVYPSYSMGTMRLAAQVETERVMTGWLGKVLRYLAGGAGNRAPVILETETGNEAVIRDA